MASNKTHADIYQKRYTEHQQRKKITLMNILKERHSDRAFSDEDVEHSLIDEIIASIEYCPSSCNRHGVYAKVVNTRNEKELLGGVLVGGVGWIHRAKYIILLFADQKAYKGSGELTYMPYLDAGCIVQQFGLIASANDLSGCFVNPNIRQQNKEHFQKIFGVDIFCGAFAVGKPIGIE